MEIWPSGVQFGLWLAAIQPLTTRAFCTLPSFARTKRPTWRQWLQPDERTKVWKRRGLGTVYYPDQVKNDFKPPLRRFIILQVVGVTQLQNQLWNSSSCHYQIQYYRKLAWKFMYWTKVCLGGHGFDSIRGLRYFLCPMLVSCWIIHLSHEQKHVLETMTKNEKWDVNPKFIFYLFTNNLLHLQ